MQFDVREETTRREDDKTQLLGGDRTMMSHAKLGPYDYDLYTKLNFLPHQVTL